MLSRFTASNLGLLAQQYVADSGRWRDGVFSIQPVVVPNLVVGRWLDQQVAQARGICSNRQYLLPAELEWSLLRQLDPSLPRVSEFDAAVLQFRVAEHLFDPGFYDRFDRLKHYLSSSDQRDVFALATRSAALFERYQFYRTDWLQAWEDGQLLGLGPDEQWQQSLWWVLCSSSRSTPRHRLQSRLLDALANSIGSFNLPAYLPVFGFSHWPPTFSRLFELLGQQSDVSLYLLNDPDGQDDRELAHWRGVSPEHRLTTDHQASLTVPGFSATALGRLQQVLVGQVTEGKPVQTDDSLVLVNAFGSMREVEALRDFLLNRFTADDSLQPGDVVVAVPDLEAFLPFIRAAFESDEARIPLQIQERQAGSESALVDGLLQLLQVHRWRFTREDVETLMRNRLVRRCFGFSEDDLELIHDWLDAAAVRWGIDEQHRAELGFDTESRNTWRQGLDRLLLGFVLPASATNGLPLFGDGQVLPIDDVEGSKAELLSRLVSFCEGLFDWRAEMSVAVSLPQWQERIHRLLQTFFDSDDREALVHQQLLEALATITGDARQAGFEAPVDIETFALLLDRAMPQTARAGRMGGGVTFTGMASLSGIPYRQICLLGMGYEQWPSRQREPGFDLMQPHPRPSDLRRASIERRYTLNWVMGAQDGLYLSYSGKDVRAEGESPPSVLVSELLDVCQRHGVGVQTLQHAMHPFSRAAFEHGLLQSHSSQWCLAAVKAGIGEAVLQPLCRERLDTVFPAEIELHSLIQFFRSPGRAFLRQQLGIYLDEGEAEWQNVEPFELGPYQDGEIREDILHWTQQGMAEHALAMSRAVGGLPHGVAGEVIHQQQQHQVEAMLSAVPASFGQPVLPRRSLNIQLQVPDLRSAESRSAFEHDPSAVEYYRVTLTGTLGDLTPQGYEVLMPQRAIYAHEKINRWLQHLVLNVARPAGVQTYTHLVAQGETVHWATVDGPESLLAQWLAAYIAGQSSPLPLFPKSSMAYAQSADAEAANRAANAVWNGNMNQTGEGAKAHFNYLYRGQSPLEDDAFGFWAVSLLSPLLGCAVPDADEATA